MKKAMPILTIFLLVLVFNIPLASSQDFSSLASKSKPSLNGLEVSDYKKVRLSIEMQGVDKIGLTEQRIRTKCELRLRQAGLEPVLSTNSFDDTLVIGILIVGESKAFSISVRFQRAVLFDAKGFSYATVAPTWEVGGTGTHAGNPESIIQRIDQQMDLFLNEYLKANAK